jgi:hypothetical protein
MTLLLHNKLFARMCTLKQVWSATRLIVIVAVFALIFWAGFSKVLPWKLALALLILSGALVFRWAWNSTPEKGEGPEVYDKAKYHYDGDYPKELSRQQAFVHTGMFVGWLVEHDMIAKEFLAETEGFKERTVTGPEIYKAWDGCLTSDILTDEGNRFAVDYFDFERGEFLNDYQEVLANDLPSLYHVKDTWENYEILRERIDSRYEAWKKKQRRRVA